MIDYNFSTEDYFSSVETRKRFWFVIFCVAMLFCIIGWRIIHLSYFNRDHYLKTLQQTRRAHYTIPAYRGMILDRNGEILAFDAKKIIIGVDPYSADADKDLQKIHTMAEILSLNPQSIIKKFKKKRTVSTKKSRKIRWIPICEIHSESLYEAISSLRIKGVYGIRKTNRAYPIGKIAGHITGFVNHDGTAVSGVERHMDFYLRGQDGYVESERDGNLKELLQYRTKDIPSKNGYNVTLTVDKKIQQLAYEEMHKLVDKFNPCGVSIIVSDVATGELLAMVNYPEYDPNNYGKYPLENMKNLAVCNVYEPASVFKIVAMSFGLEYNLVNEDTIFDCTIPTAINRGRNIKLPKDHTPFDKITFVEAMRKSSNRAAAFTALMIGEQQFFDCVKSYGFGEKAGYGFDGESAGILFPPSKWDAMTITRMAMGHAIGIVPLQAHCAMSVIANNGILLRPNIFHSVSDNGTDIITMQPIVKRRVISQNTAERMRNVMHNPNNGTLPSGIKFGGKSGTGQKLVNGKYSHNRHTSSYSGFFPVDTPQIVITVIVDDAHVERGIAWGSTVSLPTFKSLAERIVQYLDLNSTLKKP